MKATKTHISLETAKLLKDCGVESEYIYFTPFSKKVDKAIGRRKDFYAKALKLAINYPAYTWNEILWEYPGGFFGEEFNARFENTSHIEEIVNLLATKKYDKADEYFRENCKLIK